MVRVAVIPAAGEGLRAYPLTQNFPKVLFEVGGRSLLERNIDLLRQQLSIKKVIVVTGFKSEEIRKTLRPQNFQDVEIEFLECADPKCGLARGLLVAKDVVKEPFVTILGDELYLESNHDQLLKAWQPHFSAVCGIRRAEDAEKIRKNYSIEQVGTRIRSLVEKPATPRNEWMGVGSYILSPDVFQFIENAEESPVTGRVELTDVIDQMAKKGEVHSANVGGRYFNINTSSDVEAARLCFRDTDVANCKVSVVIPAFNEAESIAAVIDDFKNRVFEVIVVDNQSHDNTKDVAERHGARVERVCLKGYGDSIRHGFSVAQGDILVALEADHSFRSKDLGKFLEYLKDADMVIGSRTARPMIAKGAPMTGLVRLANMAVGFCLSCLWPFHGARFTDVGCTYRAIWRDEYQSLKHRLHTCGPEFSTEMMVEMLRSNRRILEIPVSYYPRQFGESKHSASYFKLARTALRMIRTIIARRLKI